ncbi:hypothetical protein CROQUDRAFT_101197 [Cronartium quercuum f. sp. fusiforme G11]|uniref:Uncharacterized protein n=1 Tax=Cronartium quercuum f. sp. fusiforme G11 TaxID=708437 RepID=A0A9P6T5B5_9BASI|nr:hypothetical protein CROQUDRAFT_101197 [Cronartium quercuum f. sp. fusiforme G11]
MVGTEAPSVPPTDTIEIDTVETTESVVTPKSNNLNPQADQAVKQGRRDYPALQKQQANAPPPPKETPKKEET